MTISVAHLNGNPANSKQLATYSFAGYAHFTAMQIRDRSLLGLDLHLERLRLASDELFGQHLPNEQVIAYLQTAVASANTANMSLTCFVASQPGEFASASPSPRLDVLIKVASPAHPPIAPLALEVIQHERHLAHVKHVGEVGKTLFLRQANARGFDDAAFEDRHGRISEATIWNLAFWDGRSVIWPVADFLPGVTMQILARRLAQLGIPQQRREIYSATINEQMSAVVMNSWTPGVPVSRIGNVSLAQDPNFLEILREAYSHEIPTALA